MLHGNAVQPFTEQDHLDVAHIQEFVLVFLRSYGADVQPEDNGVWRAELPALLASELNTTNTVRLSFSPKLAATDAEYITFGHPWLDHMCALASQRGMATSLLFTLGLDPEFMHQVLTTDPFVPAASHSTLTSRRLTGVFSRLVFPNSRKRIIGRRMIHQLQVLFTFRVSFVSDEKRESIVPVLIDPATENIDTLVNTVDTVSLSLCGAHERSTKHDSVPMEPLVLDAFITAGSEQFPKNSYSTLRLYRRACEHLEQLIRTEMAAFHAEAQARLAHEIARIEEYYKGLALETLEPLRKVFRRMASLSVRTQLARSYDAQTRFHYELNEMKQEATGLERQYDEELQQLSHEKERHLNELSAKYLNRVELHLVNVAALRVPRLEYTLRLHGPARREMAFLYDVLRERLVDLQCEVCEDVMQEINLCSCGHVVCATCYHTCACGKAICPSCAAHQCHVCGAFICSSCDSSCPFDSVAHLHYKVCPRCKETTCIDCIKLSSTMGL